MPDLALQQADVDWHVSVSELVQQTGKVAAANQLEFYLCSGRMEALACIREEFNLYAAHSSISPVAAP